MSQAKNALTLLTVRAATTCPRILTEISQASHGVASRRRGHLRVAKAQILELLGQLEIVEINVEREEQSAEAEAS